MQLGLSTSAFFGRMETEEAAKRIARLPVDCAEVFLQAQCEYTAEFGRIVRDMLGDKQAAGVHPLGTMFESNLFSISGRQRADAERAFFGTLAAAREMGASRYVYHGRPDYKGMRAPTDFRALSPRMNELCAGAGEYGVRLCWENVFWCQIRTPADALAAADACPDISFVLDIKQALLGGQDPHAFISAMGGRLKNVHLCDIDAHGHPCLPGRGAVDFSALFGSLVKIGYDGPVILEPYPESFRNENELVRSLEFLRGQMNA